MKAVVLNAPNKLSIAEIEKPVPGEGEALLKIVSMGICGSDVSAYKGKNPQVRYPLVLGHELGAVVEEIGENEKGIKVGDRVVVDPYIYCGSCYPCSIDRTNCCENLKVLGTQVSGGMQEYLVHPAHLLHKVPDNVPWEQVPIAETMCISLHSIRRARVQCGDYFAIFGAGPIGLIAALLAKNMGAMPILIDVIGARLEKAKVLGIDNVINSAEENLVERVREITKGTMATAILEASGAGPAIQAAFEIAAFAGRLAFTGWPAKSTELNTAIFTRKELDICGSRVANHEFEDCLEYLSRGVLDINSLITKVCSFNEIPEAIIEIANNPEKHIKVVGMFE